MEAKRRRLDTKNIDYSTATELLNSVVTTEICEGLIFLKEKIVSRVEAILFLDKHHSCFLALLTLFDRLSTKYIYSTIELEVQLQKVLRESISVIANICNFSVSACAEINQWPRIYNLLLNLLQHPIDRIKLNVLRLVGNLCKFNETSSLVVYHPTLLENIASNIKQDDQAIAERSLRVIRLLARNTVRLKPVISTNCVFYIGTRISRINSPNEVKHHGDILQILVNLLRVYPKDVGRQLVGSGCAPILLDILLNDEEEKLNEAMDSTEPSAENIANSVWRSFVLKLTRHSYDVREAFGREAIYRVLSAKDLNGFRCEFLCHFAQDAWSRVILSESSALARMLDLLDSAESNVRQQMKIIASLKHFIYDRQTLTYLCGRGGFLSIAMAHIRRFVDENRVDCKQDQSATLPLTSRKVTKEAHADLENVSQDNNSSCNLKSSILKSESSDVFSILASKDAFFLEKKETELVSRDYFVSSKGVTSPNDSRLSSPCTMYNRWVWSPSMSPNNSSFDFSSAQPPSAPSLTLERTVEHDERYLLEDSATLAAAARLCGDANDDDEGEISRDSIAASEKFTDIDNEKLPGNNAVNQKILSKSTVNGVISDKLDARTRYLVVMDCLEIISKLTHQEENYPHLIKEEVIRTLIDYVSDTSVFDPRIMRSVFRLSRCRASLEDLLEMNFHIMVVKKLVRRSCILKRFSKFCRRCDRCREFGCDLIKDFAGHVDSNMGWYHIEMGLRNENTRVIQSALTTGMMLFRGERSQRFYSIYSPIEMLILNLESILKDCAESQNEKEPISVLDDNIFGADTEQGRICSDIIMAFSSLITRRTLRNFSDLSLRFSAPQGYEFDNEKRCSLYEVNPNVEEIAKLLTKSECFLDSLISSLFSPTASLNINNQVEEIEGKDSEKKPEANGWRNTTIVDVEKTLKTDKTPEASTREDVILKKKISANVMNEANTVVNTQRSNETEMLEFYNVSDMMKGPIIVVPKAELCNSNPYFKGMFDHEFAEKTQGRFQLRFDESVERCDEADFIKFLHYLIGCRDSDCVAIKTAETCAALIHLSDKYLCATLFDELIKSGGKACTLMNGENLRHFVPQMLTISAVMEALSNTWMFVLLRYSNDVELMETLGYFRANPSAIRWLLETMQRFLATCADTKTIYQMPTAVISLWDV